MSLLLDALKKAAEQKAEKSRQEVPAASPSDETVITADAEDETVAFTEVDETVAFTEEDETVAFTEVDETIAFTEEDETVAFTREDKTVTLDEEDVTEFMGEPGLGLGRRETPGRDDATEVDQTEFQTRVESTQLGNTGEATEIDQTEHQTHHTVIDAERSGEATEFDQTEYQTHHTVVDAESSSEVTELQKGEVQDEDLSLMLVDHNETDLTSRTSLTAPQTPQEIAQTINSDETGVDELALVDTTQHQIPHKETETETETETEIATAPQTNAATGIASTTQTTQHTTTQVDSTSTRTYAPDNYDRTLMKLPNDDASQIFAGMKSDDDVVMTPDYAKKVFRSKSSAQRMQIYKVYTGIAVAILLSISIFGAFEFQEQSNNIDSSLRPLKRDPMPGIIKPEETSQEKDLFAESTTNVRTIEIIESVDSTGKIEAADEAVVADEAMAVDNVVIMESTVEVDNSAVIEPVTAEQAESVATTRAASVAQVEVTATRSDGSSSTLEIISSNQVEQKHLWLREAYNAYKTGDDSLAMTRYNQVLEVDPANRNALLARAAINVQNGNSNAAIKDYQTLLLHNPKDSVAMTSLIAVANLSPLETESQLKLMIRDEPDSPYLNFALANAYGAQNRWQEAQGYYFKALENNPQDPNYAYNLAVSLEHIAQPVAALSYYQRALDNINHGLATFNREIVNQRMEILAKR
jgi:tetratricopeptide (TPR) repeat protein